MGAQINPPSGLGPYCFRIHGQIYHRTSTLHSQPNKPRKFSQLYILDPDEATEQRMLLTGNSGCNSELMRTLSTFMVNNNSLAEAFRMLYEVELEV